MKSNKVLVAWQRMLCAGVFFTLAFSFLNASAEGLRHIPSAMCGSCHQQIYQQWQTSMHANSTALKDPIHGAFYKQVVGDPLQEGVKMKDKYPVCLQCHAPTAAKDGKTQLNANPSYEEGINCVSCHTLTHFKGIKGENGKLRLGMKAYDFSDDSLQGSSGLHRGGQQDNVLAQQLPHPFPLEPNQALLKTSAACLGCHDKRNNSKGVSLCQTGDEIDVSLSQVVCQSCHMPKVNGVADHSMAGGHSAAMVSQAIFLTLETETEADTIKATLNVTNQLPHNFPTGAPFRNFFIKVSAFDKQGKELWRNYQSHPIKDDPQSMFMYTLGDDDGKPAPPPKATQVLSDTRLKPHESRTLSYTMPAAEVSLVRAEALYNLLLPPLVKKLDAVLTPDLKAPKTAAVAEVYVQDKAAQ